MSNKDFKLKNGLVVSSLSTAGVVTTDTSGNISSSSTVAIANGGTGQTTAGNALNALLPLQTGNINYYLQTNGTTTQWNQISYVPMSISNVSSNTLLSANTRYFVDTSSARTLTLPSSPSVGDEIQIIDNTGGAATNNITIASNSLKINGSVQDGIIDLAYYGAVLIYTGSSYGWRFN